MDDLLVATLVSEGGKLISELLRISNSKTASIEIRYPEIPDELPGFTEPGAGGVKSPPLNMTSSKDESAVRPVDSGMAPVDYAPIQKAAGEKVATSCVGCAIGHLATCSGLLKEAVRFSDEGMASPNIISRLNTCLDELNAMERVDLQPAKIADLPDWEKVLAHDALRVSRETRHFIEAGVTSADQLEKLAANLIQVRERIGQSWLQQKLRALSAEDKQEIQRRVMAKLNNLGG